ncbi:hypothetical protein cypCar_00017124 [Cyprinus carpio]|nr:hypothetical protein cypCar_00017124 [Cyprinus carpio]
MSEPSSPGESQCGAPRFFVGCAEDESEGLDDYTSMMTDMELYEDDLEDDSPPERQIVVGICCMMKKSKSKPMTQILERLCKFEYITVVIFPEDVILNEPVEKWPLCDCLISFHSKGFPLDKAVSYVKLRNPLLINDLNMQYYIQDRREVYRILQEEGIDLPRYAVLNRDPDKPDECNLVEGEDQVEVNGEVFLKPFVEKPVSAEDHNVYIYYPTSAGGGSQRLFRKVYTVGPDYAHAEARKSPALDGKVERDSEGKEIRYPVMLTAMEKLVARKVCLAFKEVLDITRTLLADIGQHTDCEIEEKSSKLEQLKTVLEMYGHFSGINRKVQLTYLPHGQPKTSSEEEDTRKEGPSILLVLKWGGELTPAGRVQAEELGRAFRCMYPGGQGDYAGFPGCGLLRLHSTYRHDLKIYASDEGRVQMTAAAFAKGLLALEGELTPILVQMVKSANMNGLLDNDIESLSGCQQRVKARLHEIMQKDEIFTEEDFDRLAPTCSSSLVNSMKAVENPVSMCDQVYTLVQSLTSQIRKRLEDPKSADLQLYHSETLEMMLQRWSKLERDFRMKSGRYDISKIPDIYDCVKYDVQHNSSLGLEDTLELFKLSRALANVVIPQEYGINKVEKLDIAYAYCLPLVKKIQLDLQRTHEDESVNKLHPLYSRGVLSPGRHVRTRLYFTSESHVHSLLSIFRYGGLLDEVKDQQWKRAMDYLSEVTELNYMTQIVIMLYEDNNKDPSSEERFHVELHFSPGVKVSEEESAPMGFGFRPASAENDQKQTDPGSLENLVRDEPDRALPLSETMSTQRKSPLIRNRKTGSMEVLSESSSSKGGSYRLFPSCSRQSPEMKQSGLGSQCAGLFSTTVLGGSSSAPNLQDYARTHRKKFSSGSLTYKDELLSMPAVKRFSVSFAKHPTNGFEGCSMVPSIYPLETLHNSLSLKQVNEFLTTVCENAGDSHTRTTRALSAMFDSQNHPTGDSYIPHRVLSSSVSLRQRSDRPPCGPSSTVSSAGPSSPTTADTSPRFSFSEKITLTPQSSEEIHAAPHNNSHCVSSTSETSLPSEDPHPSIPSPILERPSEIAVDSTDSAGQCLTESPCCDEAPSPAPAEPDSPPTESFCRPSGSLPVLPELRESSSEAGSSAQTPLTPEEPDEFFDTQETLDVWRGSPGTLPHPGTPLEVGSPHVPEP